MTRLFLEPCFLGESLFLRAELGVFRDPNLFGELSLFDATLFFREPKLFGTAFFLGAELGFFSQPSLFGQPGFFC
ncbi:hypothetical protein HUW62_46025 [Myxococcus sp. AM011]|uniref:hypothetical protein n=1 Tax=Myxococcus sp. AM011 TaxID=2745200 RepID=UPI001595F4A5|nr:hypothetical protein [Myxococcus sp. AM011]NVJ28578.1 hypothetical protein [Myxococcus sp. AM011]